MSMKKCDIYSDLISVIMSPTLRQGLSTDTARSVPDNSL